MATIGALGDIVFSVSTNTVKTFRDFKRTVSPKFASHNRHLKDTLLEYTGNDPDKISFSMMFSVYLGTEPHDEIKKLKTAANTGKIMYLVIGRESFGNWVITALSESREHIDNKGNTLVAKVDISLTAYAGR